MYCTYVKHVRRWRWRAEIRTRRRRTVVAVAVAAGGVSWFRSNGYRRLLVLRVCDSAWMG